MLTCTRKNKRISPHAFGSPLCVCVSYDVSFVCWKAARSLSSEENLIISILISFSLRRDFSGLHLDYVDQVVHVCVNETKTVLLQLPPKSSSNDRKDKSWHAFFGLDVTCENSVNTLTVLASKIFYEPSRLQCATLTYCKKRTSILWFIFIVRIIAEPISSIVAIGEAKHHYVPQSVWVIKPFGRIISCVCWFSQNNKKKMLSSAAAICNVTFMY